MRHVNTETLAVFGLPVTDISLAETVSRIEQQMSDGRFHQLALVDLDCASFALRDPSVQRLLCECSLLLAEGSAMGWASGFLGVGLRHNTRAIALIEALAELSADRPYTLCLLGNHAGVLHGAAAHLTQRFPNLRTAVCVAGGVASAPPPDDEALLQRIHAFRPSILLAGFGSPEQDQWIHRNRARLRVPVSIGVGRALERLAGRSPETSSWSRTSRANKWLQCLRQGLAVPERLRAGTALVRHLLLGFAANRLQPEGLLPHAGAVQVQGAMRVISTPAHLTGNPGAGWLLREANAAASAGEALIVDLSGTRRVEADGLGSLLEARRVLLEDGQRIWLAGMSKPVRRILQFSALSDLFRIASSTAEARRFILGTPATATRSPERIAASFPFERPSAIAAAAPAG